MAPDPPTGKCPTGAKTFGKKTGESEPSASIRSAWTKLSPSSDVTRHAT
jgi:hypothetical protein